MLSLSTPARRSPAWRGAELVIREQRRGDPRVESAAPAGCGGPTWEFLAENNAVAGDAEVLQARQGADARRDVLQVAPHGGLAAWTEVASGEAEG